MVKHIQVDPTNFINLGKIAHKLWLLCYFFVLEMKGWLIIQMIILNTPGMLAYNYGFVNLGQITH